MLKELFRKVGNSGATSRLDEEMGTFSLNNVQLYVGSFSSKDGSVKKGISLLQGLQNEEYTSEVALHAFSKEDAQRLVAFLDELLAGKLPATFRFPASESRLSILGRSIVWEVSEFIETWHGGGGYKGSLEYVAGIIITKSSAESLRGCVRRHFGIDR